MTQIRYRPCLHCAKTFVLPAASKRQFCSKKCRNRRSHLSGDQAKRRGYRLDATARRRARHKHAVVEQFAHVEVFDRDGWICGLCEEAVDPSLAYPHLMSASLDHVIPLVHGGEHSRANTQCSHFLCNSLKRDAISEPVMGN